MYTGKNFNIPVFSPPYKCKKTCTNNSTKFHRFLHRILHRIVVFCEKFTGVSFFVKKFTGWRMIHIFFRAWTRKIAPARQWIIFLSKASNTISVKYTHYDNIP